MDVRLLVALVGVGGVLAGAFTTALVSVFTGWLTRRHEARRWLLDQRLETYVAFNEALQHTRELESEPLAKRFAALHVLERRLGQVSLVAPMETAQLSVDALSAAADAIRAEMEGTRDGQASRRVTSLAVDLLLRQRVDIHVSRRDRRELLRQLAEPPPHFPGDDR